MNQRKKQVESEILSHAFNFIGDQEEFTTTGGKKAEKLLKQTMDVANQIVNKNDEQVNFVDVQIQLSKLERAAVLRIACSNKHAIVITNTGSAYSWGENDHG